MHSKHSSLFELQTVTQHHAGLGHYQANTDCRLVHLLASCCCCIVLFLQLENLVWSYTMCTSLLAVIVLNITLCNQYHNILVCTSAFLNKIMWNALFLQWINFVRMFKRKETAQIYHKQYICFSIKWCGSWWKEQPL